MLLITNSGFIGPRSPEVETLLGTRVLRAICAGAAGTRASFEGGADSPGDAQDEDTSLDEAAKDEREYVRRRLRDELGREPTETELDEWLRQHTEGY